MADQIAIVPVTLTVPTQELLDVHTNLLTLLKHEQDPIAKKALQGIFHQVNKMIAEAPEAK